jgi:periplasmic protein TonB
VSRRFGLPLAASLVGHGALLILLVYLMARLPPMPLSLTIPKGRIEVLLAPPPLPVPAAPALPPPLALPPPPPPIVKTEPPPAPPVVKSEPPPPPPPARTRVSPRLRHPAPAVEAAPKPPVSTPPPAAAPPPVRPMPAPAPAAPVVSTAYRAALSAWFESHKQYPESARSRGEEGQAVLRFRADRSGRVLGYSIVRSTGYADLDAAIERMMRGAVLPPFPADMTAPDIEVSVPVRFALAR